MVLLSRDISREAKIIQELGRLDLTKKQKLDVYCSRKDEVGMIADATKELAEAIYGVVVELKEKSSLLQQTAGVMNNSSCSTADAIHLALTREDTFVAGVSMGGFGALHTGLTYPETFGKIVALSSALITHEVSGMREGEGNNVANYDYYSRCFGRPEQVLMSVNNPERLVEKLQENKLELPEIYMACGTEDFLLEENRQFHRSLTEHAVKHCYLESPGSHDMVFWREYFCKSAQWIRLY